MTLLKPTLLLALALSFAAPAVSAQEMTAEEILERLKAQRNRSLGFVKESEPAASEQEDSVSVTEAAPEEPAASNTTAAQTVATSTDQRPIVEPPTIDLTIYFGFDSAVLKSKSKSQLNALCLAINSDTGNGTYKIIGHTDAKGKAAYNQRLSLARADEVVRYMTGTCGLDGSRFQTLGAGEGMLKAPHKPNAAENRRVEVQVLS